MYEILNVIWCLHYPLGRKLVHIQNRPICMHLFLSRLLLKTLHIIASGYFSIHVKLLQKTAGFIECLCRTPLFFSFRVWKQHLELVI